MTNDVEPRKRPARWRGIVAVALVVQALVVVTYFALERARAPAGAPLAFEPLSLPLPALTIERPGQTLTLPSDDEVVLLHLWATWCAPCLEELPTLLPLDGAIDANVLLVSSDENWEVISRYFEGDVPASVWRVRSGFHSLPVDALPTTFVVRRGNIVAKLHGARQWTREHAEDLLRSIAAAPR